MLQLHRHWSAGLLTVVSLATVSSALRAQIVITPGFQAQPSTGQQASSAPDVCGDGVCGLHEDQPEVCHPCTGHTLPQCHCKKACEQDCGAGKILSTNCTDQDGGIDLFFRSEVRLGQKTGTDHCIDKRFLYEFSCGKQSGLSHSKHDGFGGALYECTFGCRSGACKRDDSPACIGKNCAHGCEQGECLSPPADPGCEPTECLDGTFYPRCDIHGFRISYVGGDPCRNPTPAKDPCTIMDCAHGCQGGQCLPAPAVAAASSSQPAGSCAGVICPASNLCVSGECISVGGLSNAAPSSASLSISSSSSSVDPCEGVICIGSFSCRDGECIETMPATPVVSSSSQSTASSAQSIAPSQLVRGVLTPESKPQKNNFIDTDTQSEVGRAANLLYEMGIIGGYPDGTFREGLPVNRAEAAKFLVLARFGSEGLQPGPNRFSDVPTSAWFTPYVLHASTFGIIAGHPDDTFRPSDYVNTAEFLKMISKAFLLQTGYTTQYFDVPASAWFAPYAGTAYLYDLFPVRPIGQLLPQKPLTRGEVAVAIVRVLQSGQ